MRFRTRIAVLTSAFVAMWAFGFAAQDPEPEHSRPDQAKIANPLASTAASLAAGEKIFNGQCAGCHGRTGKGDGKDGANLNPKPADLTDTNWTHGSSDADIFTLVRDGSKGTGMKGFGGKLSANDIWNVVNYLHSLGSQSLIQH